MSSLAGEGFTGARDSASVRLDRNKMLGSRSVKTMLKAAAFFAALALAAPAWAQAPALPSSPQTINIIDVAGNLALTQKAIEKYRADHAEDGQPDHLHQGAGARAGRQDQGAAERRPRRHRPRAHRHRRARRRHRAGALDRAAAEIRRQVRQSRRKVPASRRGEDAEARRETKGSHRRLLPVGTAPRVHAREGEAAAADRGGAARLVQGQSQPLHVRASRQFGPGPHLPDGSSLHSRRQGPEGSGRRAGTRPGPT